MIGHAKRTLNVERLARIYDDEIAPCWGVRFSRLLLRELVIPERGQVLDASCGTGYPTTEILRRMPEGARLIAIDESSAMLDVARRKVAGLGALGRKVYFRTERALPKLSFADDVYDLVVCNLGVGDLGSLDVALGDFARVAKPGGEVRCTLPLAGTFQELHDLYREVLIKHDKHDAQVRLDRYIAGYPTFERVERALAAAGLVGAIEIDPFSLLFRSARELFYAPVIEYGPLADWKAVAGGGQDMQDVFWYIKQAIDAYFADGPFYLTVHAGCVIARKPEGRTVVGGRGPGGDGAVADRAAPESIAAAIVEAIDAVDAMITTPVLLIATVDTSDEDDSFDDIDTGWPWPPREVAGGAVQAEPPAIPDEGPAASEPADPPAEPDVLLDGQKRTQAVD